MSQHPSLRISQRGKGHRSVLKRAEKIKILEKLGKWKNGDSVFGLHKVKTLRFKIKKEKAAPAPTEEAAVEAKVEEAKAEAKEAPPKGEEKSKGGRHGNI